MSRNAIIIIAIVVIIAGGALIYANRNNGAPGRENTVGGDLPGANTPAVKEFTMTSYYDPAAQRPFFSLREMTVNRGDRVRVRVTNIMGVHDFTLDEFGVKEETPLNEEVVVEFTADRAGEFVYYCSKPGHRAAGQWGTLKVAE